MRFLMKDAVDFLTMMRLGKQQPAAADDRRDPNGE